MILMVDRLADASAWESAVRGLLDCPAQHPNMVCGRSVLSLVQAAAAADIKRASSVSGFTKSLTLPRCLLKFDKFCPLPGCYTSITVVVALTSSI